MRTLAPHLATTAKRARAPKPADCVCVDWGPEFAAQHGMAFPDLTNAGLCAGLGPLGLGYVFAAGGSGYFRLDAVRPHLTQSQLHSALAYYFDHQKEIDRDLKRNADVEHWRGQVRELAAA